MYKVIFGKKKTKQNRMIVFESYFIGKIKRKFKKKNCNTFVLVFWGRDGFAWKW